METGSIQDSKTKDVVDAEEGSLIIEGPVVGSFPGGLQIARILEDAYIEGELPESLEDMEKLGFGRPPKESTDSTGGGDLTGHACSISHEDGTTTPGVIVVHRPPIAFAYTHKLNQDLEGATDGSSDASASLQVWDKLAQVRWNPKQMQHNITSIWTGFKAAQAETDESALDNHASIRPIFATVPEVADIALINSPLITGITMVDVLTPIGRGQNMLMIGHDLQDMRQYVRNILQSMVHNNKRIQNGKEKGTKCVYASNSDTSHVRKMLEEAGLLDDVVVVSPESNSKAGTEPSALDDTSKAARATVATATACSIAETYALEKGMDTLVIVDTFDQHKDIWDATTRFLIEEYGEEAVVKGEVDGGASSEMRGFLSSLVQRSAQYNKQKGGGSLTLLLLMTIPKQNEDGNEDAVFAVEDFANSPEAVRQRLQLLVQRNIPLTAANLKKIKIPQPNNAHAIRRSLAMKHVDDIISMSDGQIFFDEDLQQAGQQPPMDFSRSLTRIGIGADTNSRADAPAIRSVTEGLRIDLAQIQDLKGGTELMTELSQKQTRKALAWALAMYQPSQKVQPRRLSESCTALLAASEGYLDACISQGGIAGTQEGEKTIRGLLEFVQTDAPGAMEDIDTSFEMSSSSRERIEDSIRSYFSKNA
eukprot:Nitzschia sp. Nitz4//scaffold82_size85912//63966//65989//NITZ4_005151-RA/size85912-augustus-gene-0.78-mRNA-1//1//CDS//3329558865//3466//frame0